MRDDGYDKDQESLLVMKEIKEKMKEWREKRMM